MEYTKIREYNEGIELCVFKVRYFKVFGKGTAVGGNIL